MATDMERAREIPTETTALMAHRRVTEDSRCVDDIVSGKRFWSVADRLL
jgi:hypothetical protein